MPRFSARDCLPPLSVSWQQHLRSPRASQSNSSAAQLLAAQLALLPAAQQTQHTNCSFNECSID